MKKRLFILSLMSTLISYPLLSQKIVIDKRAIGQVTTNSAAAVSVENQIAHNFKKCRKAQEEIAKYVAIFEANRERIQQTQKDISAFKQGSINCLVIIKSIGSAFEELGLLAKDLTKYPIGAVAYSGHIRSISEHIVSIGASFVSTVTDGKVRISGVPIESRKVNLIDPVQRLELTNQCIYDLNIIRQLIWQIRLNIYCRNSLYNAALTLVPKAVDSYYLTEKIAQDIISEWKRK